MDKTFVCIGATNHVPDINYQREKNDFYATEPIAVTRLLEVEKFQHNIYECCCGLGHIAKELEKHGYNVYATDLIDRGYGVGNIDFLQVDSLPCRCDIVTNPPYKYAKEFILKALDLLHKGDKLAMLLKLTFLESQSRKQMFLDNPPKVLYVFSKRVNCAKNGDFNAKQGCAIAYGWYVWEKGYKGDTVIKWIN